MSGRYVSVVLGFALGALVFLRVERPCDAFGDRGAFDARVLLTGSQVSPVHPGAAARWAFELVERTSAPAQMRPTVVRADDPAIVDAPFLYWSGSSEVAPLTAGEMAGLRSFLALGGVLLIDDSAPGAAGEPSAFGRSARREMARILPESAPIVIGADHVLFHTFYLLDRPEGRVKGAPFVEAIVHGGQAQVLFTENDLGGALAQDSSGAWALPVIPDGELQREHAVRLAVNIAMYVLCSNYKDDQVHAPYMMRKRARIAQ
jgi:uncharacterized protein DUF4159